MAKGVARAKPQQRSITSFFTAPAQKRKAPEKEERDEDLKQDATEEAADVDTTEAVKKTKRSDDDASLAPTLKAKSTKAAAKTETVVEEEGDELKAVAEPVTDDDDVKMEKAAESSDDDDVVVEKRAPMKSKPGRRRLRQRQVEESDEDDEDFGFPSAKATKKQEVVVDLGSSEDEESAKPVAGKKKKQKKENTVAAAVAPQEEEPAASVDAKDKPSTSKVKVKDEIKNNNNAGKLTPTPTKKTSQSVGGFFTARTPEKTTVKTTEGAKNDVNSNGATAAEAGDVAVTTAMETDSNENTPIPYSALAHMFNTIEATSSRLAIQNLLIKFFRDVIRRAPQDLLACIYLCVCTDLAPPFENLKIGIGDAILMKAIGEATGTNMKFIKDMYQKEGDLGKVAQNARSKQHTLSFASMQPASAAAKKPSVLGVQDVYNQFVKIAKMTGNNSQQQKCSIIKSLLVKCEKDRKQEQTKDAEQQGAAAEGAKYIIRGLQGKLRIGLAEKSILIGLTYAFMQEKDQADKEKQHIALASVKKAFAECPSYNALVAAFQKVQEDVPMRPLLRVEDFAKVAERCVLTPGTPVSPMLARPTKAYAMVFDRFQGMPFTCEYKYDGERAQIHILPNGEIAIFSRNFENSTERFPDVKLMIAKATKKSNLASCIVDAEVVAVDKATNKRLPFQILSTRSRKNVKVEDIKVPVCIYAFDLLFLNGESYLTKTLAERRAKLKKVFELEDGSFELASSIDIAATEDIKDDAEAMEVAVDKVRTFLEEAVKEQCEGLMVKTLHKEATYEPANRSHKWLKLKKDYLDGIGDSTDLVPIGAFFGRGKRTGVYGAYLLACYDPDTEMYQPITKLGTGLSDEVLKTFHEQLKEKVVDKTPQDYATGDGINPDVWFEPTVVWEILGADLSISPKYTAAMGLVARDKGISLRFPRFIRIRDDKSTTQATTSNQIADLYRAQGLVTVSGGAEDEDDDMLI